MWYSFAETDKILTSTFFKYKKAKVLKDVMLKVKDRWGDKISYLKNVKCSGEQKNMAALTL